MSGGHFNYAQHHIHDIAENVEQLIRDNKDHFADDVIEQFKTGLKYLNLAYIYAQRIDRLVSGDDGEDSFRETLSKELKEIGAEERK